MRRDLHYEPMNRRQEREVLRCYGSQLIELNPAMIVQGAQHDLKLKQLKAQFVPFEATLLPVDQHRMRLIAPTHQYLFHRKHVARARDAEQLIARAVDDREIGCASAKYHTRLIYQDRELLRAALALARNEPAADDAQLYEIYRMLIGTGDEDEPEGEP